VKVIYFIQEIFYNLNEIQEKETLNDENFQSEIKKSATKSFEERYDNKGKDSSLKFSPFNKYHQLILDKILKQNKDVSTYDRIEDFKNWFMNNFMEIIQNNEIQNMNNK
jgi:hypothetical protein